MKKKLELVNTGNLIEYKGDLYTAEQLAEKLSVSGEFDVIINKAEDSWFGRAMLELEGKKQ